MRRTSLPLLVAAFAVGASIALPRIAEGQGFALYVNAFLDSTRAPATRVTVEVPFRSLVFLKKEGRYDARYEVYVSIRKAEDSSRPDTHVLRGFATVKTYEETKKRDLKSRTQREFHLAPGEYTIDAMLTVKNTRIALKRSAHVRVPDFLASGIGFGTPVVLSIPSTWSRPFVRWDEARAGLEGAEQPADGSIAGLDQEPAVRFALYTEGGPPPPLPCTVYYEVLDPWGRQILYARRRVQLSGRDDEFVISFNVDDWSPGLYKVNLRAAAHEPDRQATASVDMRIDVTRAMLGVNFKDTLEILHLIAAGEELEALEKAPESERAGEWEKFWVRRDPDPITPENEALREHLARVQHVIREFSQLGPGWRSDRGRIYIRYGAPEHIETAADRRSQGEYEIWRYYSLNRVFVFYDMFGVGDFKLVEGEL